MNIKIIIPIMLLFSVVSASSSQGAGSQPITKENWVNHPEIKKVRVLYNEINNDDSYRRKTKTIDHCDDSLIPKNRKVYDSIEHLLKTIEVNDENIVRYYNVLMVNLVYDKSFKYYYDRNGMLRFVYIEIYKEHRDFIEHRIYYDEKGVKIWEIQKYLQEKDADDIFYEVWPEKDIIKNPVEHFSRGCE